MNYSVVFCSADENKILYMLWTARLFCMFSEIHVWQLIKHMYSLFNYFASIDIYTRQTLPDRLTVDVSHEIWCLCVWTG